MHLGSLHLLCLSSLLVADIATQSDVFEGRPDALVFTHSVKLLTDASSLQIGIRYAEFSYKSHVSNRVEYAKCG